MDYAVKFVDGHDDLIEGMLAPFGGTDFTGEHFETDTNFELEWFGDWERPLLYAHGEDPALKTSVLGRMKLTPTDKGIWMQAQLDKAHAYKDAVAELVAQGALGLSAGSIERFYWAGRNPKTGAIKHFPIIEGTMTPVPAHPEALLAPYATKSIDAEAHLAVIGVEPPEEMGQPDDANPTDMSGSDTQNAPEPEPEPKDDETLRREKAEADSIVTVKITADASEAIKQIEAAAALIAVKSALTPQSLHDAAVASGASCASDTPPVPLLAIAGKSAEPVDLDAFAEEMRAYAIKEARTLLG